MKFLRKYKILLMHIALIILLLGLVVEFCEEIQTMKQAVYYRLFPEPEAEAEVEEGGRETILPDIRSCCILWSIQERSGIWIIR